jgi:hypothetical protein
MPTAPNRIQTDSVFLYLSVGKLRTRRKLSSNAVATDIDRSLLHISKDTMQSPELEAIGAADNELRAWIKARCLPSPFRKKGVLILPVRLLREVMERIDQAKAARLPLIETFMSMYAQRKAEAMPKLASGFDERDYPPDDAVRGAFTFEHQLWELSVPGSMAAIDRNLYERELQKMTNMWDSASQTINAVLLEELRKLTSHLSEKLQPGVDGKGKTFRNSTVTKLTEWLDLFSARNLGDDVELVSVVERARALISGVDPENIRDSDDLRNQLATDFKTITEEVDAAIIARPIRSISLDDEEA